MVNGGGVDYLKEWLGLTYFTLIAVIVPLLDKGLPHFPPFLSVQGHPSPVFEELVQLIAPSCFLSPAASFLISRNPFC